MSGRMTSKWMANYSRFISSGERPDFSAPSKLDLDFSQPTSDASTCP